jgi:hypothetical protein
MPVEIVVESEPDGRRRVSLQRRSVRVARTMATVPLDGSDADATPQAALLSATEAPYKRGDADGDGAVRVPVQPLAATASSSAPPQGVVSAWSSGDRTQRATKEAAEQTWTENPLRLARE